MRLAVDHPTLDLCGAADSVYNTAKFGQQAVAGVLYDTTSVFFDLRIDQLFKMRFEALMSALLVHAHQPRVARNVGGEDRGEAACRGHVRAGPLSKGMVS